MDFSQVVLSQRLPARRQVDDSIGILWIELNRFEIGLLGGIEGLQHEAHAAQVVEGPQRQVVVLAVVGHLNNLLVAGRSQLPALVCGGKVGLPSCSYHAILSSM